MRFTSWPFGLRLPELGDICCQISGAEADDADHVQRAYRVVGFLEGPSRERFKLVCERVEYGTLPESLDPEALWTFYNVPRGA